MNRSKARGTAAETAVVRHLQANGQPLAERRAQRGIKDAGDITGTPGLCWSVKGGDAARAASDLDVSRWLGELTTQIGHAHADLGVLVLQRRGKGPANAGAWWTVMPLWTLTLLELLADVDVTGAPGYTGALDLYAAAAQDPDRPWMLAPVRMLLADVVTLLRAAGYGEPLGGGP